MWFLKLTNMGARTPKKTTMLSRITTTKTTRVINLRMSKKKMRMVLNKARVRLKRQLTVIRRRRIQLASTMTEMVISDGMVRAALTVKQTRR